jgi:hypothetical protein
MPNYWRELTALFITRWEPWAKTDLTLPPVALGPVHIRR